ncbi:MAG: hypothetical protein DWQ51_20280 [Microcystis wesenbergii TW10]|jgi:hypothetical protein|uniref:Uncharacterized protein n=5 Tax=Microcystis TaxID=1125 RepID=A0A0A1VU94_MICAE|nr:MULTISPECIES: DUF6515 family protein [Microcystis]MDT3674765.1 DUF6515 family protein [Microcystis wesenbergii NRERC-220]REJ47648.1 MAG: hypothetical protein DWQ51_20280 [Microcystis wesenbergii TW10]TRT83661.1 MAG: hypothetical protein EWV63_16945 [Microcystis aeruginosa Ma_OC_H_19870700_S124]GAL92846.1 hypothetical protein N44_01404 [Microcystis aeruginosa NIES-44]
MKRALCQNLCVLAALLLGTSLLVTDYVDARGGGGGGSRGGGGGSRGGGGASPRVSRSSDLQNRGNFSNRSQPSRDFSGRQGERQTSQQTRQGERTERQGERQTSQQTRQGERTERQGERQTSQQNRQGERSERTDIRQGERSERQGERQQQVGDRQQNRQNFIDDNRNGYWRGGGWYGGGYYVPPGWGWVGLTTGLVIGSALATLPPYYNTVYVGSTSYIYSDGIYLQPSGSSYTVVAPPIGAIVTYLPDGCTTITADNTLYYNCSGIYYRPLFENGSTVYQVVRF